MHWLTKFVVLIRQQIHSAVNSVKPRSDEKLGPWLRPGTWFWIAVFAGLAVRIYFVLFTQGTYDVSIWQGHIVGLRENGLVGYYHANREMNHPPFISVVLSWLWSISQWAGVPFRILLRAPFALLDAGTAVLLLYVFRESRYRFVVMICYWLNPLTMIFSAYHGNTDSAVAFFLMLCMYFFAKEKLIWAGVALGISLWVKLPGILAMPAFLFFLPRWRARLKFLFIVGVVAASTYLPTYFEDPHILFRNVFGYQGQIVKTTAGVPVWGAQVLLVHFDSLPLRWQERLYKPILFYDDYNMWFCIVPIVLLSWLRRSEKTIHGLGRTIAGVYTILYGFSSYWSFQYFAWSVPFWFFVGPSFVGLATLLAGGYIYALYWLVCGNPWLSGQWDFVGHPYWPDFVELLRNLGLLFFILWACIFLIAGVYRVWVPRYNFVHDSGRAKRSGCKKLSRKKTKKH